MKFKKSKKKYPIRHLFNNSRIDRLLEEEDAEKVKKAMDYVDDFFVFNGAMVLGIKKTKKDT